MRPHTHTHTHKHTHTHTHTHTKAVSCIILSAAGRSPSRMTRHVSPRAADWCIPAGVVGVTGDIQLALQMML